MSSMPLTTWAAVITRPSPEIRTSELVSAKRTIPGADVASLAPHDDDGRAHPAEDVIEAPGLGRPGEDRGV